MGGVEWNFSWFFSVGTENWEFSSDSIQASHFEAIKLVHKEWLGESDKSSFGSISKNVLFHEWLEVILLFENFESLLVLRVIGLQVLEGIKCFTGVL